MQHTNKERALWSIGIAVVVFYALIPVAWITSISLKTPEQVADRKFFSGISFKNYDVIFSDDTFINALINSIGIASIATAVSILRPAVCPYATSRGESAGRPLPPWGALAGAFSPPISIVGSLFDMWRAIGL